MFRYSIFISHNIEEKSLNLLDEIERILTSYINVYVAEWDPRPGENLAKKIESEIKKCDAVLVILTKEGAKSEWVNQEIGFAKAHHKLIIPVKERGTKLKGLIADLEWSEIDLKNPHKGIENVNKYIDKIIQQRIKEEMARRAKEEESQFWWTIGTGILLIISLIILAYIVSKEE